MTVTRNTGGRAITGVNTYGVVVFNGDGNFVVNFIPKDYATFTLDTVFPITGGIYVGETGDVSVVNSEGVTRVIPNIQAGTIIPGAFKQINSASTVPDPEDNIRLIY
jgi:hypothetical protein